MTEEEKNVAGLKVSPPPPPRRKVLSAVLHVPTVTASHCSGVLETVVVTPDTLQNIHNLQNAKEISGKYFCFPPVCTVVF